MKPNTPGFSGFQLKRGRELRGLSVATFSELLGVSRQAVSKYENGTQSPRPEIAQRICSTLRLPLSFFTNTSIFVLDQDHPICARSIHSATKTARVKAVRKFEIFQEIVTYLESFVEFPRVNLPDFDVPLRYADISPNFIEEYANNVRRFWNLGNGPISNVVWLLENNGIFVGRFFLEADTLDGFSQWSYKKPFVVLASDKGVCARSRFDAAHELGHLLLHRNITANDYNNTKLFPLIEAQAHRFAAAFLLPKDSFLDEIYSFSLDEFRAKKARWKLSIKMMIKRAIDLDCLSEDEGKALYRSYGRRGWSKNEPLDDEIPVEQPQLIIKSFTALMDSGYLSKGRIISDLCLDRKDIEDIAALPSNFLREAGVVVYLRPQDEISSNLSSVGESRTTQEIELQLC
jgi:Zn-dependent peptidase ImmA (M78 family)/transcriptional regulator with XRE-family HTH domain